MSQDTKDVIQALMQLQACPDVICQRYSSLSPEQQLREHHFHFRSSHVAVDK